MSDSPLPILFVRNPCEGSDFYLRFLFLFQNNNQEKEKKIPQSDKRPIKQARPERPAQPHATGETRTSQQKASEHRSQASKKEASHGRKRASKEAKAHAARRFCWRSERNESQPQQLQPENGHKAKHAVYTARANRGAREMKRVGHSTRHRGTPLLSTYIFPVSYLFFHKGRAKTRWCANDQTTPATTTATDCNPPQKVLGQSDKAARGE